MSSAENHAACFSITFIAQVLMSPLAALQSNSVIHIQFVFGMVSVVDAAKRELVKLLRSLALVYSVVFSLTRDSADADVLKCFKQVSRKAHPDKGGKLGFDSSGFSGHR